MITGRIIPGERVFVVRQEFGLRDAGGKWYVRERRIARIEGNYVWYTERVPGVECAAPRSLLFASRARAHEAALNCNTNLKGIVA
jgi:hypothetical protein